VSGNNYIRKINGILKKNRNILSEMNPGGKTRVHQSTVIRKGFDFTYITSRYITKKGTVYYFCYDQGYLPLENNYYMLVRKQTT